MLKKITRKYYRVKRGQTIQAVAAYFCVSAYALAKENGLTSEPCEGRFLRIPEESGNAYIVREGDTKASLCGSDENFEKKNGTDVFYIGMRVIL